MRGRPIASSEIAATEDEIDLHGGVFVVGLQRIHAERRCVRACHIIVKKTLLREKFVTLGPKWEATKKGPNRSSAFAGSVAQGATAP